jgi:hypothetical protein
VTFNFLRPEELATQDLEVDPIVAFFYPAPQYCCFGGHATTTTTTTSSTTTITTRVQIKSKSEKDHRGGRK